MEYHIQWTFKDTLGSYILLVFITEGSSIQRSFYTLQYYIGRQNGVLITEVSTFHRFVIERFYCNYIRIVPLLHNNCMH